MPGLTLYTSNRLEVLADRLAAVLRRPGDPLQTDVIIVQSRGMERWVALALARRNGIVANCQFPFPNAFIEDIFRNLFAFDAENNPFERNALAFRILRLLPALAGRHPAFNELRDYFHDDPQGVKRFQLAAEVADLLDQYQIFRPGLLLDWEANSLADTADSFQWQPILWRHLTREVKATHRAAIWREMIGGRLPGGDTGAGLPERVSLFGVSYLPPYYLHILQALAKDMAVDIYQLNPCQEFWSDIASEREMARMRRRLPEAAGPVDLDALHLEAGNRLLASMGAHGREFHTLISEIDCPVEDCFEEVVPETLLKAVQHDLLHLTDRGASGSGANKSALQAAAPDSSIQIHACHGPMREIEVLRDQLLALLDAHPDIEPRDILVMTPDIETYAPYIQAVFGASVDEDLYLPFSIADRSLESASPLVEGFNRLLDLRDGRFSRSQILALLEFEPLRAKFGLSETDLAAITDMIDRVGIRWGLDGAAKARWELPTEDANTWRHGLDRLALGYALMGASDRFFQHLLPDDGVQANQAAVIGRLNDLIEALAQFSRTLDDARPSARWHDCLVRALTSFVVRDERFEYDFQILERLLADFRQGSVAGSFDEPVDLAVVRAYLKRHLSQARYRGGFIAGGLTFGALLPMRSIPAEVVCLVGLNHDLFPRLDRPRSFDLMAQAPRLGDRSRRSDDRYLFLEALISARRCLYISYAGFDLHDNAVRPPSVLVSELCDYLQDGFGLREDDLVVKHRLQAFSPAYFQPGSASLFSYSSDHARSAHNLAAATKTRPDATPFLTHALEKCPASFMSLTPQDLLEALTHPCRFLLERRLDMQLRPADQPAEDREAFELSALAQFQEGQWLTRRILAGLPLDEAQRLQQARGVLPHGEAGQSLSRRLTAEAAQFADRIKAFADQHPLPPRSYRICVDGYRIDGRLEDLYPEGPVVYRYSRANGRALMSAWIQHLVFCHLAAVDKHTGSTVLVCRDEIRRFQYVPDSAALLAGLLDLYFQAAHVPLPIFPQASPVYARQRIAQNKPANQALRAAQRAWEGTLKIPGDKDDPYIALGFRGFVPWTEDFENLAGELFSPLFENSETIA